MKILQQLIKVKRHSRVSVHFSRPCNVYLMTEVNYKRYKEGASFKRLGGPFEKSPAEFTAPYDGAWHAVIEKGSHVNPQPIEGRVEVLSPLMKEVPYLSEVEKDLKHNETEAGQMEENTEVSDEIVDDSGKIRDDAEEAMDDSGEISEEESEDNVEDEEEDKD